MEKKFLYRHLIILFVFLFSLKLNAQIINGADLLFSENLNLISGKKVGVVCNHTSLLADGKHLVDALLDQNNVSVKSIFTPEHGFKGSAEAGGGGAKQQGNCAGAGYRREHGEVPHPEYFAQAEPDQPGTGGGVCDAGEGGGLIEKQRHFD